MWARWKESATRLVRGRRSQRRGFRCGLICTGILLLGWGAVTFVSGRDDTRFAAVVPRPHRISPELRRVPVNLPQGGDWQGVDAFPDLDFDQPVRMTGVAFSGDLYVFEQRGLISRVSGRGGTATKSVFLDLRGKVMPDNRGPAAIAFHPHFGQSGSVGHNWVFIAYKRSDGHDVVSRFVSADGKTAVADSETVLIEQRSSRTHAGGALTFGNDGFLYVSSGEERHTDQRIDISLLGGVFRIDVDQQGGNISHPPPRQPQDGTTQNYFIPRDNPFVGQDGALEEFWALGLRNPFTMTTDRGTGDIWIGDVGRNTWEEINRLQKGGNYEWSYREGRVPCDRMNKPAAEDFHGHAVPPLHCYEQSEGNNAVIGGFVYRGDKWPELYGKYIFGDNGSSRIWALTTDTSDVKVQTLCQLPYYRFEGITGFGTDSAGEIYVCILGNRRFDRPGKVLRLVPNRPSADSLQLTGSSMAKPGSEAAALRPPSQPVRPVSHATLPARSAVSRRLSETGLFRDLRTMSPAPGVIPYAVNVSLWSDGAIKRRWVALPGDGTSEDPRDDRIIVDGDYPHVMRFPAGTVFVKHFEMPINASNPPLTRRLETRVIVLKSDDEMCAMTYRWNDDETEAWLISDRETVDLMINRQTKPEKHTWTFPNTADCRMCHNRATGFVLGVNVPQLNCSVRESPDGDTCNQLMAWNEEGLLSGSAHQPCQISDQEIETWPRLKALNDSSASLQDRVLSYLSVNCSQCHRRDIPGRPPRPVFDLRYHIPFHSRGLIDANSVVVPGDPHKSRLRQRLAAVDLHRMPPVGRAIADQQALAVITEWIRSLD